MNDNAQESSKKSLTTHCEWRGVNEKQWQDPLLPFPSESKQQASAPCTSSFSTTHLTPHRCVVTVSVEALLAALVGGRRGGVGWGTSATWGRNGGGHWRMSGGWRAAGGERRSVRVVASCPGVAPGRRPHSSTYVHHRDAPGCGQDAVPGAVVGIPGLRKNVRHSLEVLLGLLEGVVRLKRYRRRGDNP